MKISHTILYFENNEDFVKIREEASIFAIKYKCSVEFKIKDKKYFIDYVKLIRCWEEIE